MEALVRRVAWVWRDLWDYLDDHNTSIPATSAAIAIAAAAVGIYVRSRNSSREEVAALALEKVLKRSKIAEETGAISPLAAEEGKGGIRPIIVQQEGIPCITTVLGTANDTKPRGTKNAPARDAFASIPPSQLLSELFGTHAVVLNRFPIIQGHVVITTKDFRPQDDPMQVEDFAALWECVTRLNGLGFFNCGSEAGASQPRAHTQVIPLDSLSKANPALTGPFDETAAPFVNVDGKASLLNAKAGVPLLGSRRTVQLPVEAALADVLRRARFVAPAGLPFKIPQYDFPHAACMLGYDVHNAESSQQAAKRLHRFYLRMLQHVTMESNHIRAQHQLQADLPAADRVQVASDVRERAGSSLSILEAFAPIATPRARKPKSAAIEEAEDFTVASTRTSMSSTDAGGSDGTRAGDAPHADEDTGDFAPHNLLITRQWMIVVPRSKGEHAGVSVNALAYAGLFAVRLPTDTSSSTDAPTPRDPAFLAGSDHAANTSPKAVGTAVIPPFVTNLRPLDVLRACATPE